MMPGRVSHLSLSVLCFFVVTAVLPTANVNAESNMRQWETVGPRQNKTDKLVCYYPLPDSPPNTTIPHDLDPMLCTHVIFIPTSISATCEVSAARSFHLDLFAKVVPAIRKQNPALTVMLSNGGEFDPVLASPYNMSRFINSTVPFLRKYDFDGFDLDWEFPGWNGRPDGQRHNFSVLTMGLRELFEEEARRTSKPRLLLTAAVSTANVMLGIYEFHILAKTLDYVNLMGYDFNSFNLLKPFVYFNCPLKPESYDKELFVTNNLEWASQEWVRRGIPIEKMWIGMPTYVHTYTLLSEYFTAPGSPARGKGQCDFCGYTYACQMLKENGTRVFDKGARVPYVYRGDQWVSYDDVESLTEKAQWVKDHGFGGVMVWNMINDDTEGICDGKTKWPLINAIKKTLFGV
ncbi:acidic mammalian chitinase-like [Mizuhopecten yessoensis]|uniref:Acidic mammalian chitinase n=1 Tax=Mizuhopecten yessoensis TaxID=6573 RepID=A0A210R656_MIZYE|nr:acidic mammalian chitinase-like [Mizuhopecten yessoensis]XP_021347187.1 acidic mammalian chitinase-like [Mizuhopecten yessoensis]OWF56543.1 Acidic mammalian chitinase [Mizuhopecten yessoensis]